jgi:hypothetical protein
MKQEAWQLTWHFLGSFVGGYPPLVFLIMEVAWVIKHQHHQVIFQPDDHVFEVLLFDTE